jgi:hypothetical protein
MREACSTYEIRNACEHFNLEYLLKQYQNSTIKKITTPFHPDMFQSWRLLKVATWHTITRPTTCPHHKIQLLVFRPPDVPIRTETCVPISLTSPACVTTTWLPKYLCNSKYNSQAVVLDVATSFNIVCTHGFLSKPNSQFQHTLVKNIFILSLSLISNYIPISHIKPSWHTDWVLQGGMVAHILFGLYTYDMLTPSHCANMSNSSLYRRSHT